VDSTRIVSGSKDGTINVWDGKKGMLLNSWKGHFMAVSVVVWNHDGTRIASGSMDKIIKIWDAVSYELLLTLGGHSYPVKRVCWNHDSSRILSVGDLSPGVSEFLLRDGMTGGILKTVTLPLGDLGAAVWNHDSSKLLVGGHTREEQGVIAVWDGQSLTEDRQLVKEDMDILPGTMILPRSSQVVEKCQFKYGMQSLEYC
jgi:WD40 repeat protein